MATQDDPLAKYYKNSEKTSAGAQAKEVDPLSKYYKEPPMRWFEAPSKDIVSQELRAAGYEPEFSEELERQADIGKAEALRGIISGATLGASEYIPGLKTEGNIASESGKLIGSIAPISKLLQWFQGPIVKLAAKSPILQRQLTSLASITGSALGGTVYGGAEQAIKGEMPSEEDLLAHGLTWAAIDAGVSALGLGGQFVKSLFTKAGELGKPKFTIINDSINALRAAGEDISTPEKVSAKVLEILETPGPIATGPITLPEAAAAPVEQQVAQEALNLPQVTAKDLTSRKVSEEGTNALKDRAFQLSEPIIPKEANFQADLDALSESTTTRKIEGFAPRAASEQELGENIKADIENQLQLAKDEYAPAYELAEESASFENTRANRTAKEGEKILESLEEFKTRPEGYNKVINYVKTAMEDAGIVLSEAGEISILNSPPVDRLMRLSRRLNETINYETLEPAVRSRLKPLVQSIKQDIRAGLKDNPEALEMYNHAENEFIKKSEKFNNDTVRRIRTEKKVENLAKNIESPTDLEQMKAVLSPSQIAQVERELLEKLNTMPVKQAEKKLRELQKHLSKEGRKLAEEMIAAKHPLHAANKVNLAKQGIYDELSESVSTGARPTKTLKLWETKEGQNIVYDALEKNPNGVELIDYLQKQSFNDFVSTVLTPEGKIDFKKFNKLMQDPAIVDNIRHIGGPEAVRFFKELEGQVKKVSDALKRTEKMKVKLSDQEIERINAIGRKKEKGKEILQRMVRKDYPLKNILDKAQEELGITSRALLHFMGYHTFGFTGNVGVFFLNKIMTRLSQSSAFRKSFKRAVQSSSDPSKFLAAFESLYQDFGE